MERKITERGQNEKESDKLIENLLNNVTLGAKTGWILTRIINR